MIFKKKKKEKKEKEMSGNFLKIVGAVAGAREFVNSLYQNGQFQASPV